MHSQGNRAHNVEYIKKHTNELLQVCSDIENMHQLLYVAVLMWIFIVFFIVFQSAYLDLLLKTLYVQLYSSYYKIPDDTKRIITRYETGTY